MKKTIIPVIIGISFFISGCGKERLYSDNRLLMGTIVEVVSPDERAGKIVFDEMARVEKLLSVYDPGSEIARLNRYGSIKASPETFFVVKKAVEFCKVSGGAFDVTVGPLVDAWGFKNNSFRVPSGVEIRKVLKAVGCDKIVLIDSDNVIQFKLSRVKINLGGIGKGYAIDRAVRELKRRGVKSCLINCGGQVFACGRYSGRPWKIGIRNPRAKKVRGSLSLEDQSISTSGDDQRFFASGGRRYSHIIDPRTGYPVTNGLISVSVVASSGVTADVLSTAVAVLGLEKGRELLKKFPGAHIVSAVEEGAVGHSRRD
jgi:FAD:protein FMN transferase